MGIWREAMEALRTLDGKEIKLFGKWSYEGIEVRDLGLKRYICLKPAYIPHTEGRHAKKPYRKAELSIVERLVNQLMSPGKNAGKKNLAINIVRNAFELIYLRTGANPMQVLVKAIENSAPMEETTRIAYGGIVYHTAVDISPQRRADLALRHIAEGARNRSFGNPKSIEECLAEEIILASQNDGKSYAIQKREEMERIALASR